MMTYFPAWPRSSAAARGGRAGKIRQTGEIAFLQHHREGFLVGQHVLAELRAEACQTFIDRRETILRLLFDARTRPHETGVIALEHAAPARRLRPSVSRFL